MTQASAFQCCHERRSVAVLSQEEFLGAGCSLGLGSALGRAVNGKRTKLVMP